MSPTPVCVAASSCVNSGGVGVCFFFWGGLEFMLRVWGFRILKLDVLASFNWPTSRLYGRGLGFVAEEPH